MTISKLEFANELINLGINRQEALQRASQLDNNQDNGISKLSNEQNGDEFVSSQAQSNDPDAAFLRAGAVPTSSDMYRQTLNSMPDAPDLGALQDQFMQTANADGDPELDAEARRLELERKYWDRWDAKQRQFTLYLKMILSGIKESASLAKSA